MQKSRADGRTVDGRECSCRAAQSYAERRALEGIPRRLDWHGYDFVAPLTDDGHIDLEAWKAHRGECFAHRFWGGEPSLRGLLVHRAGGRGGSTWSFEWNKGARNEEEEEGFRFGDHAFKVGEYVSVREEEGELLTFRVTSVGAP